MAAIAVIVDGGGNGIKPTAPIAVLSTVAAVDGGGNSASLPLPPLTMTTILALIALTLALAWTRIVWRGGGCAVMHCICCCHGCRGWCHLCLRLQDNGGKDDGRGNRQGCTTNIHGWKEVGHHDPIGVEHGSCGSSCSK
jgi:hypothetical protein